MQLDGLLFEFGDPSLELLEVRGSAEAGFFPDLFAEGFGQPVAQVLVSVVSRAMRSWAFPRLRALMTRCR